MKTQITDQNGPRNVTVNDFSFFSITNVPRIQRNFMFFYFLTGVAGVTIINLRWNSENFHTNDKMFSFDVKN